VNRWIDITRATNAQILAWAEAQPWAREMAACEQDAQWHAEGDVWTHTRMVRAELERLADWPSIDRAAQLKLLFTALFHDAQARHHRARSGHGPHPFAQARAGRRRDRAARVA
jgi:hypothetical protein